MKNTAIKTALATLIVSSLVVSCKKKDVAPEPEPVAIDHSLDSVELLATGKGFKKVYGYIEPNTAYYPGTLNEIHGIALSVEGTDKVNFAFSQSSGSQQGTTKGVQRGSANYATKSVITAPVGFTYTTPTGSSWQELGFMYAPYSNKLGYMYYDYSGPGYVTGDVTETSGQSLLTSDRRIAKTGHSVYSIVGSQGAGSGTETNGFTYAYYDASNAFKQLSSSDGTFTGIQFPLRASNLYKGIFEPIIATNEGIVILYSKDSINVYLNNLTTPAVKFTLITKIALTTPMALAGYSIVKNNANDNDFSFACVEGTKVWSFKYNNTNKTVTKVLDGATLPAGIKNPDIDENGNLYYISANLVGKVSTTGNTTIAQDVLTNGTLAVLKHYNGKLFLLAERFKNNDGTQGRRQLDVLVQE
jgi:hypothetical protein